MIIPELFSKTYDLVKTNLILVQPLLLFLLLLGFILAPLSVHGVINMASIIMVFSVLGLFCAFLAGWFNMIHRCIKLSAKQGLTPEEKALNSIKLFSDFFPGVGKYFLKVVFGLIIYVFLLILVINFVGIIGQHFIGFPQSLTPVELSNSLVNEDKAMELLNKMSDIDKIKLAKWNILTIALTGLFSYITMFWIQAIVSANKNPIAAYFESLKTVIKNPVTTLLIYISYWASIIGVSILSSIRSINYIAQFLILMVLIFTVVYFTIMMFLYFERYRKNNCTSRTDCVR